MLSVQPLILATLLTTTANVEMLEFTATWCGPCQQMKGTVNQIRSMGYSVQTIDFDRNQATVQRFRVSQVPTYVFVVNGREVDRIVGATPAERLLGVFSRHAAPGTANPRANPTTARARTAPVSIRNSNDSVERLAMQASVRLRVEDAAGHSFGSGTMIHVHGQDALIVTCGHIFRDSQGKGRIVVDLFAPGPERTVMGELIRYDLDRDIALVGIKTRNRVTPARLAGPGLRVSRSQPVFSIGCNRGKDPSVMRGQITAINKYLGPDNLTASGQPVDGRSGGGLFTAGGHLVGVCNAADPEANEGLYAAYRSIHTELDHSNLAFVYNPRPPLESVTTNDRGTKAQAASRTQPARRPGANDRMPAPPARDPGVAGNTPVDLAFDARPAAAQVAAAAGAAGAKAEVICIIRSPGQPGGDRLIVLDRPSRDFMSRLQQEDSVQRNRRQTELRVNARRLGDNRIANEVRSRTGELR